MLPGNFVCLMNEPLRIGGSPRHQNAINWALPGIEGVWGMFVFHGPNRQSAVTVAPGAPGTPATPQIVPAPLTGWNREGRFGCNVFGHGACLWMHGLAS
jgi:hypothetical protein